MSIRVEPPATRVVIAREWHTPLTGVERQHGAARLRADTYAKGIYPMEGIGGYEYVHVRGPGRMPVAVLQRRTPQGGWKTWMVDDPLHWDGMRERVMDLPPGRLLVAGLGLGLFAHHLMERPDITAIDVIEIDPDVIGLIEPTLPDDPRRRIVNADFYRYIREQQPQHDAVLWDLAVGGPEETRGDFYRALGEVTMHMPGAVLSCFGLRDGKRTILG